MQSGWAISFFNSNNYESSGKREHFIQKDADSIPFRNCMVLNWCCEPFFASVIEWRIWDKKRQNELFSHLMVKILNNCVCLRSFARMFSLFLPPFYAPAFAQLVHESNSIGLGISFAIVISLGLVSCFVKYRAQLNSFLNGVGFFRKDIFNSIWSVWTGEFQKDMNYFG